MNFIKDIIKNRLYDSYLSRFDFGAESRKAMKLVKGHTMSTPIDMATLYELVIHLDRYNVEGDLVECGVWKGGSAGIMAAASLRGAKEAKRVLHLFDLFDDIVAPDPEKDAGRGVDEINEFLKKKGKTLSDISANETLTGIYDGHGGHGKVEIVRELLVNKIRYPESKLCFHVGLFQDTVPAADDIGKIAMLRLDGDWYDSIKIPLDHLYDRVVKGGVVIIDDYWTYEGCRRAVDEFMEENKLTYFKCYSRPQTRFFFKT
ncbi:MAG: class I SAM-dependent methyltransferase [Acidobacteria bacterium]|nr:class I SAM-dependent methyltransferase [Acidobacteriota bacterium]